MNKYMEEAKRQSEMSTCLRRRVGAVVVKDDNVLIKGYNKGTKGIKSCIDVGCIRNKLNIPHGERREICRYICAEQVIVSDAARRGISLNDACIYITSYPCSICAKLLINAGIKKIICMNSYKDKLSEYFIKKAGVEIEII